MFPNDHAIDQHIVDADGVDYQSPRAAWKISCVSRSRRAYGIGIEHDDIGRRARHQPTSIAYSV